jgi:hypothetical protein
MPRLIATAMTRIASVEVVLEFDVTARLGPSMRSVRLTLQGLPSTEDVLQSGNSLYVAAPGPPPGRWLTKACHARRNNHERGLRGIVQPLHTKTPGPPATLPSDACPSRAARI